MTFINGIKCVFFLTLLYRHTCECQKLKKKKHHHYNFSIFTGIFVCCLFVFRFVARFKPPTHSAIVFTATNQLTISFHFLRTFDSISLKQSMTLSQLKCSKSMRLSLTDHSKPYHWFAKQWQIQIKTMNRRQREESQQIIIATNCDANQNLKCA